MSVTKTTTYGGDVVMFLLNKIIENKKLNYEQKNVGLPHGFKTMCKSLLKPWVVKETLHMVLKPFARPS